MMLKGAMEMTSVQLVEITINLQMLTMKQTVKKQDTSWQMQDIRNGEGFPVVEYLYNTSDAHKAVAEALQFMWEEELGVKLP